MSSATSNPGEQSELEETEDSTISSVLKFVVSNLKTIVSIQLDADNYPVWKAQIAKKFRANGFDRFLDSSISSTALVVLQADGRSVPNRHFTQWGLTDQNLAAAICSTISSSILPYVVHLESTASIWTTLASRFQSTNRSKVIQLKNSLHNISLKNQTITQYLFEIKKIVDQISASGATVDHEDVLLYILNGLPPAYQSFKTSIRTMLTPLSLDQLYPLLMSEEINIASDNARAAIQPDPHSVLFTTRGRGRRSKGRTSSSNVLPSRSASNSQIICQICDKRGHPASSCWHRTNLNFVPRQQQLQSRALAANTENQYSEWFLDSGATKH